MLVPLLFAVIAAGTTAPLADPEQAKKCDSCEKWNQPQEPFHVHGNTWYVGVGGLSSILIVSPDGSILLDGALPQSAARIRANIRTLGFRVEDIKLIVNSHAHFDHAGGIAALARDSGAEVAASALGAKALQSGRPSVDDPQYGLGDDRFPAVPRVRAVADGETLQVGDIALTAHYTPGHTPGATTWTWKSCQSGSCLNVVYADSLNAVSRPQFRFLGDAHHPDRVPAFERSIAVVRSLPCDILLTVHPDASSTLDKFAQGQRQPDSNPFIDSKACQAYADGALQRLNKRVDQERAPTTRQ